MGRRPDPGYVGHLRIYAVPHSESWHGNCKANLAHLERSVHCNSARAIA